ncbi:MAG: hypothetical protein FWE91_10630 [Defluviitaleaceae bacterium]|nr:hypothetical protein [Defluviitaleaceae bacterium]MCL2836362.1 hypothetical protein [Defluviitaleaceae bacterium]
MKKRIIIAAVLALGLMMVFTGCIPGDGANDMLNQAGFFKGVWHGWIAPISLIASLFNSGYSIYEAHNVGFWYNFGFYIAIISEFGGISLVRSKSCKR